MFTYVNRYSRTWSSSADCLQLADLAVPTGVGDRGTAKMPLTMWRVETRESAVSRTTHKMRSLQQRADGL